MTNGLLRLNEDDVKPSPMDQFLIWFTEVSAIETGDPTAMVLSTVDALGHPDSRVVLLKDLDNGTGFIFYTNYDSVKGKEIAVNSHVALNFYWPKMARQVRVRGQIKKTDGALSDHYFASRPRGSQLGAMASPQSQTISNRDVLEQAVEALKTMHQDKPLTRPAYWGGYIVIPEDIEFWQGRENRLHDRIYYYQNNGHWCHHRLAP